MLHARAAHRLLLSVPLLLLALPAGQAVAAPAPAVATGERPPPPDMGLVAGTVPVLFDTFEVLSNRVVRLATRQRWGTSPPTAPAGYALGSSTDAALASPAHPERVGVLATVDSVGGEWLAVAGAVRRQVTLVFPQGMRRGHAYALQVANRPLQTFRFTYDDAALINGSVKANQVGYLPQGPKYGYAGNYLGTAGMMPIAPDTFEVRQSDGGRPAFAGRPSLRGEDLRLSGELVYECDFTALGTPGSYYLYVPGVGRSHEFRIGPDAYHEALRTALRALYYQRCGMALEAPYADARYLRPACHLRDGYIHRTQADSPLYGDEEIGSRVPMVGGWHDAGEYGDPDGDDDERAWAAAELYKTTGEARHDSAFAVHWAAHPANWGWNEFRHHQKRASWAYATTAYPQRPAVAHEFRRLTRQNVEANLLPRTDGNAYRNGYRADVAAWIGWGAFAQSTRYAWEVILAQELLGEPRYQRYALLNLDTQFGNNPQSLSYVTGVGDAYPLRPLHHPSQHDGAAEPVPGLPVFGPHTNLVPGNPYLDFVRSNVYPSLARVDDPYPLLRRYVDSDKLVKMGEFTVVEIAQLVAALAPFTDLEAEARPAPAPRLGDFNRDGEVDLGDFYLFAEAFGTAAAGFDLDGSGQVDFEDFFRLADVLQEAHQARTGAGGAPAAAAPRPAAPLAVSLRAAQWPQPGKQRLAVEVPAVAGARGYYLRVAYDPGALRWGGASRATGANGPRTALAPPAPSVSSPAEGLRLVLAAGLPAAGEVLHLELRALAPGAPAWVAVEEGGVLRADGSLVPLSGARWELGAAGPAAPVLHPARPNPFNASTLLSYTTAREGRITLTLHNVLGQTVRRLADGPRPAGDHQVVWDGRDGTGRALPTGVYFCRVATAGGSRLQRLLLLQ
ncbi:MAG: glycoside hydrolase family 9 protein [Candidatus Latescibacterota bacterium]